MPRPLQLTLAAAASGLLLWLAFPPVGAGPLVWIALLPLLVVLWRGEPVKVRWALLVGWLAGVVFFTLNLKWLRHVTPAFVALAAYLALYPALWAAFIARLPRQKPLAAVLLTAAAWTGLEWLRGIVLTGFAWNHLGAAAPLPWLEQAADVTGALGLSFFIVAAQAGVAAAFFHRGRTRLAVLGAGLVPALVATVYGGLRVAWVERQPTTPVPMALVQPNVPQEIKNLRETFYDAAQHLLDMSHAASQADPPPKVIIWPESALPSHATDPTLTEFLTHLPESIGTSAVIFGIDEQGLDTFYNSVAVFRAKADALDLHQKVHLVPFGEYLPARGLFGRFDSIRELLPGDFNPGTSTEPLAMPEWAGSAVPLVCFEDTIGRVAREFVRSEPQVIVNVTNDAWFLDSEGADQHLANARLRTIELRRPMVRSANTGVTCTIDAAGRVVRRLPRLQDGLLMTMPAVPTTGTLTVYARVGDLFSALLLAAAVVGGVASRRKATS